MQVRSSTRGDEPNTCAPLDAIAMAALISAKTRATARDDIADL
jgi:hypothetical protein